MKKISKLFMLLIMIIICSDVYADEVYYVNNNGLEFSEFQFNAMKDMFSLDFVRNMDTYEYNYFKVSEITSSNFTYKIYNESNSSSRIDNGASCMSTFHETASKKITIGSLCSSSSCFVTLNNVWKATPSVRSHDVIGMRLVNTSFSSNYIDTVMKANSSFVNPLATKSLSNGYGAVFKLPNSGTVEYFTQSAHINKTGFVYGAYEHAVKNISLNTAKDFTMGGTGYGSVFIYPSSYGTIYDQMQGVYINLSQASTDY